MWQFICDHIEEELELIKNAPIAFIIAILIGLLIAKWRYGKFVALLKQQVSFLKDKLEYSTSEKLKRESAFLPPTTKIQNSKKELPSKKDEKESILSEFKKVDLERSQLKPEDFFSSILPGQSKGEKIIKQYNELIAQAERLGLSKDVLEIK